MAAVTQRTLLPRDALGVADDDHSRGIPRAPAAVADREARDSDRDDDVHDPATRRAERVTRPARRWSMG
jgi:hypothetical protein